MSFIAKNPLEYETVIKNIKEEECYQSTKNLNFLCIFL